MTYLEAKGIPRFKHQLPIHTIVINDLVISGVLEQTFHQLHRSDKRRLFLFLLPKVITDRPVCGLRHRRPSGTWWILA